VTVPRLAVAASAALFAALPSMDPSVRAADPPPPRPVIAAEPARSPGVAGAPIAALAEPAPPDLSVQVSSQGGGVHRIVVRRPGYLVALMHGWSRASGAESAGMRVEVAERDDRAPNARRARADEEIDRFVWETTAPGTLVTTRGVVSLRLDGAELRAQPWLAAPPDRALEVTGAHHRCVAHRDDRQGFVVLCRLPKSARHVAAANVTGPRITEGAAVLAPAGGDPLVRLDLPLSPGIAEARLIGFTVGRAGVAVRVEASFTEGDEPSLLVDETSRDQPLSPNFN
jgi:hypothetical protein